MIEMERTYRSASEMEVARLEKANSLALPQDYRRFLLEQNGGRPQNGAFPVPGWGVTVVSVFFGVGTGDAYDLERWIDRLDDPSTSELLPIACDPGGWVIYLGIRGPYTNGVYFLDREDPVSEPILIGKDFDSFGALLRPSGTYNDYALGYPPRPQSPELHAACKAVLELVRAGKHEQAEQAARELRERYPEAPDGYERLGMVYEVRGDRQQAAACYRKAIGMLRAHPGEFAPEFEQLLLARLKRVAGRS